uniref:ATP synthase F0 subunit 8 n=1 Tax=Heterotarsus carinula TaxID=1885609 RepID=UPI002176B4E1|nr:ATP synthase F0 subunit 8 [Heterotarsus carinula]UUL71694.1 ATP synthase F0 subunit 8 [Heterotarsus carinula]
MPQMAPLNWLSLMIMFIMMMLMFNILNYYSFISYNKSLKLQSQIKMKINNWKW